MSLSSRNEPIIVPTSWIYTEQDGVFRDKVNSMVNTLKCGRVLDPVRLMEFPDDHPLSGNYFVDDGNHRVMAYITYGLPYVEGVVCVPNVKLPPPKHKVRRVDQLRYW